jgi:hypothetical protein
MTILNAAALASVITLVWAALLPWIVTFWARLLKFWVGRLGMDATLVSESYRFLWVRVDLTYIETAETIPGRNGLVLAGLALAAVFVLTRKIPSQFLPLTYLLRAAILVQITGVAYFLYDPEGFPHKTMIYALTLLKASLSFITLVPLILALTYYILNFRLLRKIGVTAAIMFHLVIFAPHHYLVTMYVLHALSPAVTPLLYQFFGILLDVTVFIGLYSWGMSWKTAPVEEI